MIGVRLGSALVFMIAASHSPAVKSKTWPQMKPGCAHIGMMRTRDWTTASEAPSKSSVWFEPRNAREASTSACVPLIRVNLCESVAKNGLRSASTVAHGGAFGTSPALRTKGEYGFHPGPITRGPERQPTLASLKTKWVKLDKLDFTKLQKLDLANNPDRVGEVSDEFKAAESYKTLPPDAEK